MASNFTEEKRMGEFVKVAQVSEVSPGTGKLIEQDGKDIALFNAGGTFYATTNICPHQGGPLSEGTLDGPYVVCPWHAWVFDVTTGESPANPRAKIQTFEVKVEGNDVFIKI